MAQHRFPFFLGCLILSLTVACEVSTKGSVATSPSPTPTIVVGRETPLPATATVSSIPISTATSTPPLQSKWSVSNDGSIVHIHYGAVSFPEYGALHLPSGYFRLNPGPPSGWGTSVILLPSFWSSSTCGSGGYCQGAPVHASWQVAGADLLLDISGTIGGLSTKDTVRLHPPANGQIVAEVTSSVLGKVALTARPGEAYKPFMLSSMHISSTQWDSQYALAGNHLYPYPSSQWIITPAQSIVGPSLGLAGGASTWKAHAPTITIHIDRSLQICGWVTPSSDPNDDNIGYWAASNAVIPSITYTIVATAT